MAQNRKLTGKQERFAQLVASGKTQADAYRLAYDASGSNDATVADEAYHLTSHPEVAPRIAELQADYAAAAAITPTRVLSELAAIAFADIEDIASWDANGVSLKASDQLSVDAKRSLRDISETVTEKSRNLKIRQHSKTQALELLGKHLGMFVNRVEHAGVVGLDWRMLDGLSLADLQALVDAGRALQTARANAIEGEGRVLETDEGESSSQ